MKKNTVADSGFLTSSVKMGMLEMGSKDQSRNIQLNISRYAQNPKALAIQAYIMVANGRDSEVYLEPYGKLSTNVDGLRLEAWEVAIKDWSENEEFAKMALASRFFSATSRFDRQEGVTIASIQPGALPAASLLECIRHFKWDIKAVQLIEALARDGQARGDSREISVTAKNWERPLVINPLLKGGMKITPKNDHARGFILDDREACLFEDDLRTEGFSLTVGSDLLVLGASALNSVDYQKMLLDTLKVYVESFSQDADAEDKNINFSSNNY